VTNLAEETTYGVSRELTAMKRGGEAALAPGRGDGAWTTAAIGRGARHGAEEGGDAGDARKGNAGKDLEPRGIVTSFNVVDPE
jgi:hypothetical protein